MKRLPSTLFNLLIIITLSSCTKEEIAPQTGDLTIAFSYTAQQNGIPYYLFTEGIWTTPIRSATPLREGTMPARASASTEGKARIEFKGLNAGNYVFVSGGNSWSVQVTAGQTAGQNTEVFK